MPHFECGPSGGPGGDSGVTDSDVAQLEDPDNTNIRVIQVSVRGGELVDSIQFVHLRNEGLPNSSVLFLQQHGGDGGDEKRLDVNRDEHIIKISGKYGLFVHSVTIEKNQGEPISITAGGGEGGTDPGGNADYTYEAPEGFEIVGFYGRSGEFVDAMGVVMRKIT